MLSALARLAVSSRNRSSTGGHNDMRRLALLLASLSILDAAGGAGSKTVAVSITKSGYVPSALTIAQGDTVQFSNADTVAHQVTFKSTTGVTCAPATLVLQPAASGSCTFQNAGSYTYSDPNSKGHTYRGTVTVTAAPESVTLQAAAPIVTYRASVAVSGQHNPAKAGDSIDVLAQQCGSNAPTKLATVLTTATGSFSTTAQPLMNTAYSAKTKSATSAAATVRVRPLVRLSRVAAHRFTLRLTAAQSFAGAYASFQRYNGTLHRWVALKVVPLRAGAAAAAPNVTTAASFRSTVKTGLRVRATLAQRQAGSCYAAGVSNTVRS
jgi:plastocyanin